MSRNISVHRSDVNRHCRSGEACRYERRELLSIRQNKYKTFKIHTFHLQGVLIKDTIVLEMRTTSHSLADVLFGQIRGGVLALLYGQADKSFYVRQIGRHVNASAGAVQRELEKLAKVGLIVRPPLGNH